MSVLALYFGGVACFAAILYTSAFWDRPKPPGFGQVIIREYFRASLMFATHLLTPFVGTRFAPRRQPGRRPVVMVHGYGLTKRTFAFLGPMLARRNLGPLYAITYNTVAGAPKAAAKLSEFVAWVLEREGVDKVDIVSHSWGGAVSRYYIEQLDGKQHVVRFVAIAPPFGGTTASRFALGATRKQISRESEVCAAFTCPPPGVQYSTIWSTGDQAITPTSSSTLGPKAERTWRSPPRFEDALAEGMNTPVGWDGAGGVEYVFNDMGHLTTCTRWAVADVIAEILTRSDNQPGGDPVAGRREV